jgi:hypothetical protein
MASDEAPQRLTHGYWLVAYLDLLGIRRALLATDCVPGDDPAKQTTLIEALKASVGSIRGTRQLATGEAHSDRAPGTRAGRGWRRGRTDLPARVPLAACPNCTSVGPGLSSRAPPPPEPSPELDMVVPRSRVGLETRDRDSVDRRTSCCIRRSPLRCRLEGTKRHVRTPPDPRDCDLYRSGDCHPYLCAGFGRSPRATPPLRCVRAFTGCPANGPRLCAHVSARCARPDEGVDDRVRACSGVAFEAVPAGGERTRPEVIRAFTRPLPWAHVQPSALWQAVPPPKPPRPSTLLRAPCRLPGFHGTLWLLPP